jgi:hypothetical protein
MKKIGTVKSRIAGVVYFFNRGEHSDTQRNFGHSKYSVARRALCGRCGLF